MTSSRRWSKRAGALLFALLFLYPCSALLANVGPWQWSGDVRDAGLSSIRVSLLLTALALLVIVAAGTPIALYLSRCSAREQSLWQAILLVPILLPPLALGILLSLAFGPTTSLGSVLSRTGLLTMNSATAFVVTQVYVGMGYYVLGAAAALEEVPLMLQKQAALLGLSTAQVFWRVTLPMARTGLAVALSVTWIRTIGEFGAVVVTAYYPSGMPVQLWVNLQSFGLAAVMPLLVIFLAVALPLPWLIQVVGRRRTYA